ncbi:MAG: AAA family ATPase [Chloroflexota bacterium]
MTSALAASARLDPAKLRNRCDPSKFEFQTTAELPSADGPVGQQRATDALSFALSVQERGFNVYVAGAPGTGKTSAIHRFLGDAARARPTPDDWCYVHNFRDESRPKALRLPPGQGRVLRDALSKLIQGARREIPRAFESEDYIAGREAIVGGLNRRREEEVSGLSSRAQARGFALQATPMGLVLVPVMGNRPIPDEELAGLPAEMREVIARNRGELEAEVRSFLKDMRSAEREARDGMEAQDREVALHAVGGLVDDVVDDYPDRPDITAYLEEVREGILADIALFRGHPLPADGSPPKPIVSSDPEHVLHERAFRKYEVNVAVDNGDTEGAPVIVEANPTYPNLLGRIEREALLGALLTDFTLISPGALLRANGGYLVLRVTDLLRAPMAYEGLKRSLREGAVEIEDLGEALGLTSARGLRPDPIPLDVKIFLLGEPMHYYMLHALDPDFRELVKVRADFDTIMNRTDASEAAYIQAVSTCVAAGSCRPLSREAMARLVEESSRLAADQRKLSLRFGQVQDLLSEANHWAAVERADTIGAAHVRKAVEQRLYRSGLIRERLIELITRDVIQIQTDGEATGQINGLAVMEVGDLPFGRPSRITATIGVGREGLLDIERQAQLGGKIHSKGLMILGGYLTDTYARDKPLALNARLTFEQSYEEVEGDSASLAETLALLSRLADAPLRQSIAVTGSMNQYGVVQPIGGANEKIEGFFDVCAARGLTGEQGVIVPASNVENLMLRDDVVAAAEQGKFHVYAVHSVDEAIEIISGVPAGSRGSDGQFQPDGIHSRVDARLRELAQALRDFAGSAEAVGSRANLGADGHAPSEPVPSSPPAPGTHTRRLTSRRTHPESAREPESNGTHDR